MAESGYPAELVPAGAEVTTLLQVAESARWAAPELTVAAAAHAARLARREGEDSGALLGEGWVLHGRLILGQWPAAVAAGTAELGRVGWLATSPVAGRLRLGLAAIARLAGEPDVARGVVGPLLEKRDLATTLRADLLVEAARCAVDPRENESLLAAARELLGSIGPDHATAGTAELFVVAAARDRLHGRAVDAADRARDGLHGLFAGESPVAGAEPPSPHVAAELSCELVLALLAVGRVDDAVDAAEVARAWTGRPATVGALARLDLAVARGVHLAGGDHDAALGWVRQVAVTLDGHDLPELVAETHELLAALHESRGELTEALRCSARSHDARVRQMRDLERTREMLARWSEGRREPAGRGRGDAGVGPAPLRLVNPQSPARPGRDVTPAREARPARDVTPRSSGVRPSDTWSSNGLAPDDSAAGFSWESAVRRGPDHATRQPRSTGSPATHEADGCDALGDRLAALSLVPGGRPISLMLLDVATPSGPVPAVAGKPLLGRISAHISADLPPKASLRKLDSTTIAVVLPGFDRTSAQTWVHDVCAGVHARWASWAAGTPDAVFRVVLSQDKAGVPARRLVGELRSYLSSIPAVGPQPAMPHEQDARPDPHPQLRYAARRHDPRPDGSSRHGLPENGWASRHDEASEPLHVGGRGRADTDATESRPRDMDRPPDVALGVLDHPASDGDAIAEKPITELSFAELLTGALRAYREV